MVFVVALLAGALYWRWRDLRSAIDRLTAQQIAAKPTGPEITDALLMQQVWRDANGKEVPMAATYSYLWLADQFGHVAVGMLLAFIGTGIIELLVAWVWPGCATGSTAAVFPSWCVTGPQFGGWAVATGIVSHWDTACTAMRSHRMTDHSNPLSNRLAGMPLSPRSI